MTREPGRATANCRLAAVVVALALLLGACAGLPSLQGRMESQALADTGDTALGRSIAARAAANPGLAGIHAMPLATDAFAARVLLAAAAERSIDAQYYIWHGDITGVLLLEALWRAADRGVRVRLLLDDANTAGLDATIAALDAHPSIEVRLYNPLVQRELRAANFLTDFARVNRRMHNKSFTVDNQASIVGGRNVGDEYFGAGSGTLFADLDVLAVGPVVQEVSATFDRYWNSASAYPASALTGTADAGARAMLAAKFEANRADPAAAVYVAAVRATPVVRQLLAGELALQWSRATLVADDPAKTLGDEGGRDVLLLTSLLRTTGPPSRSFDLVSPYFVPAEEGTASLSALARDGVAVRVLTNSLASSDVTAVHAGYAKRREDLLRAGVRLYEFKPAARVGDEADSETFGSGSSGSLHAKTFAIDRERVFVGSFNFDPRSALLNTEMGLVIDSPALAQGLADVLDQGLAQHAWEVRIGPSGTLEWVERTGEGERRYASEPGAGALKRGTTQLLSILPIEWLL